MEYQGGGMRNREQRLREKPRYENGSTQGRSAMPRTRWDTILVRVALQNWVQDWSWALG